MSETNNESAMSGDDNRLVELFRDWAKRPGGQKVLNQLLSGFVAGPAKMDGPDRLESAPEGVAIYPAIFQLKITLREIRPPIWRRVLVPSNVTLARLHRIIQNAMGWWNYHLYQFTIDGDEYSEGEDEYGAGFRQATGRRLFELDLRTRGRFLYEYDFGDGWQHDVQLERVLKPDLHGLYPICTGGARNRPPEDCGGPGGYEDLLIALADPSHEDHDRLLEWVGGKYDPADFDPMIANFNFRRSRLKELKSARDRALGWRALSLAREPAGRKSPRGTST